MDSELTVQATNNNNNFNNSRSAASTSTALNLDKRSRNSVMVGSLVFGAFLASYIYYKKTRQHKEISDARSTKVKPIAKKQTNSLGLGSGIDSVKNTSDTAVTAEARAAPVRVFLSGCWDVMHSGHYNAIRQAKALGDVLVVAVVSDEEIELNKRTPIMKSDERVAAISACKWVDEVVYGTPYCISNELLDRFNCDYVAHGDDIAIAADGKSPFDSVMHRLKVFRRTPGVSTTHLIDRLLLAAQYHIEKETQAIESSSASASASASVSIMKDESDISTADDELDLDLRSASEEKYESSSSRFGLQTLAKKSCTISNDRNNGNVINLRGWSSFLASSSRISAFSNQKSPSKEDVVVYIDGDFDLFHIGHISALEAAAKLGTFLVVGLFDDPIVSQMKCNPYLPLMSVQERVLNVLSCKFVDEVLISSPWLITQELISSLNISYVVHVQTEDDEDKDEDDRKDADLDADDDEDLMKSCAVDRFAVAKELGIFRTIKNESMFTNETLMSRIEQSHDKIRMQNENRLLKARKYAEDTHEYLQES
jgi:ethanolamine-phosphate cytidylyltransferase